MQIQTSQVIPGAVSLAVTLCVAIVAAGILALTFVRGVVWEPQTLSSSGSAPTYNVVVSRTNYVARTDDDLPTQVFEQRIRGLGKRIVHQGITQTLVTGTKSTLYVTDSTHSYYPDLAYVSNSDSLEWWQAPHGAEVYTPTAEFSMDAEYQDIAYLQSLVVAGDLVDLGASTYCGAQSKGFRYASPRFGVEAWFSDPEGVRLHYSVTSTEGVDLVEECISADLNPTLSASDFTIISNTVWATHTLSISAMQAGETIYGFAPAIITASATITPLRSYSAVRDYVGIYNYEQHDWPANAVSPIDQPLGWMVVQDFDDESGSLVRIVQFEDGGAPPLRDSGMDTWAVIDEQTHLPTQLITTPLSSNPIIRDYFAPHLARWTDETDGKKVALIFSDVKTDSYIAAVVEDLIAARQ